MYKLNDIFLIKLIHYELDTYVLRNNYKLNRALFLPAYISGLRELLGGFLNPVNLLMVRSLLVALTLGLNILH